MKRKKIIFKLGELIDSGNQDEKREKAIKAMIDKLLHKEDKIRKRLKDSPPPVKRIKLQRKLKACQAQREKGEAALEARKK